MLVQLQLPPSSLAPRLMLVSGAPHLPSSLARVGCTASSFSEPRSCQFSHNFLFRASLMSAPPRPLSEPRSYRFHCVFLQVLRAPLVSVRARFLPQASLMSAQPCPLV